MTDKQLTVAELTAAHPEWLRPEGLPFVLNTSMVAVFTQRHPLTVNRAMRDGELRGTQRRKSGSWTTRIEHVIRWIDGEIPLPRTARPMARRSA